MHFSLFSQYLLPYALVLLIPLLITGFIIYSNFLNLTKDRELQANQEVLQQIRNVVDTQFVEIIRIAFQLSRLPGLTSAETNSTEGILKVRDVLNYSVANEGIEEVVFYFQGAPYMFSADTTYRPEIFHKMYFSTKWSYDQMMDVMNHLDEPLLLPSASGDSPDKLIKYLVPVPYFSSTPYATSVFFIKEASLRQLFNSMLKYKDSNAYAFDNEGQLVIALRNDQLHSTEAVQRLLRAGEQGTKSINLNDTIYLLSSVKSNSTGWTYATLVSKNEVMQPVKQIIDKTVIATVLIVLLGIIVIYLGMRYNYLPLLKLIELSEKHWGQVVKDSRGINKLTVAIEHAGTLNEALRTQTEKVSTVLREHLLSKLLMGRIMNKDELQQEGEPVGLKLTHRNYYVQLLLFGGNTLRDGIVKVELAKRYSELIPESTEQFHVEMIDTQMTAFILSSNNDTGTEADIHWHDIQRQFVDSTGVPITIGIGQSYDLDRDCSRISSSFIEAVTAIQYRAIKGSNQVIHFRETAMETPRVDWYPVKELEHLELLLRQRQPEAALEAVDELSRALSEKCTSLYMAKHIGMEVVNRIMRIMNEISDGTLTSGEYPDVMNFVRYESVEELVQKVKGICVGACDDLQKQKEQRVESPYEAIWEYIEKHALRYDFSIQSLAECIGMSKVHVYRIFKEQSDKTVMEVVNELRLKEAKRLLKETSLPLAEIVQSIGYTDVSSFIRKFKQEVNLTPGEFRKLFEK
jgi:AraC-like DNA-binding protein